MEIGNLFGLPAHPLLAHFPLVLVPLAALSALLAATMQRHRRRLAWVAAALATAALASTQLAIGSGEVLQDRLKENNLIESHVAIGTSVRLYVFALLVALLVLALLPQSSWTTTHAQRRRAAVAVVSVVVVVVAVANLVVIVRAGHSGAKAVWNDTPAQRSESEN